MTDRFERDFKGDKRIESLLPEKRAVIKELYNNGAHLEDQLIKCKKYLREVLSDNDRLEKSVRYLQRQLKIAQSRATSYVGDKRWSP